MKNKTITYILSIVVLIIWGTIVYKIFSHSDIESENTNKVNNYSQINDSKTIDTFSLSLSYEDPFLKGTKKIKTTIQDIAKSDNKYKQNYIKKKMGSQKRENTSIVWPSIRYEGMIKSQNMTTAIVKINNKSYFIQQDEIVENVRIQKITQDSIIVEYQQKYKIVKK